MAERVPAERDLEALAHRFAVAERRVRALLHQAPNRDRAALLAAALLIIGDLRVHSLNAGHALRAAYTITANAVQKLTGDPATDAATVEDLARSLEAKLHQAAVNAEDGARRAFARVTVETVDDAALDAVTARVTRAGQRVALSTESDMLTRTLGRRAVSRAVRAGSSGGEELTECSGGECPICAPLSGVISRTLEPPFHTNCGCVITPLGFSSEELLDAM